MCVKNHFQKVKFFDMFLKNKYHLQLSFQPQPPPWPCGSSSSCLEPEKDMSIIRTNVDFKKVQESIPSGRQKWHLFEAEELFPLQLVKLRDNVCKRPLNLGDDHMLDCINPVNNLKSLLEIDTCCTAPAVCGLDDLVQGDEGCLQARQLDKQVDCLLVVGLQKKCIEVACSSATCLVFMNIYMSRSRSQKSSGNEQDLESLELLPSLGKTSQLIRI